MAKTLPPLVFEHFRQPRHNEALENADAVAEMEARREGAFVRLYLRREGEGLRLGYTLHGERSLVASLSLLTTHVQGWTEEALAGLEVEALAEAYALPLEAQPMLSLALDALRAGLAALRGEPDPFADEGEVLCHCLHLRRGRILRTIQERELKTLEEVRFWTRACSGCRGCREDLEELLS